MYFTLTLSFAPQLTQRKKSSLSIEKYGCFAIHCGGRVGEAVFTERR